MTCDWNFVNMKHSLTFSTSSCDRVRDFHFVFLLELLIVNLLWNSFCHATTVSSCEHLVWEKLSFISFGKNSAGSISAAVVKVANIFSTMAQLKLLLSQAADCIWYTVGLCWVLGACQLATKSKPSHTVCCCHKFMLLLCQANMASHCGRSTIILSGVRVRGSKSFRARLAELHVVLENVYMLLYCQTYLVNPVQFTGSMFRRRRRCILFIFMMCFVCRILLYLEVL